MFVALKAVIIAIYRKDSLIGLGWNEYYFFYEKSEMDSGVRRRGGEKRYIGYVMEIRYI